MTLTRLHFIMNIVQYGGGALNKTVTSREAILSQCKAIVRESGMKAVNLRDVAKRCGVAVGSVYNYFPSKEHLITATVESIWTEIMHQEREEPVTAGFIENIVSLFARVQTGTAKYPYFFSVHSTGFGDTDKAMGRGVMNQYFAHIEAGLLKSLEQDQRIRKDAFSNDFTKSEFISFIFTNLLSLIRNQADTCDFLTKIIYRTIY